MEMIKNLFYKSCFCLGLATATYCAYGQVQQWFSPSSTHLNQSQLLSSGILQEKRDALLVDQKMPEKRVLALREGLMDHRPVMSTSQVPSQPASAAVTVSAPAKEEKKEEKKEDSKTEKTDSEKAADKSVADAANADPAAVQAGQTAEIPAVVYGPGENGLMPMQAQPLQQNFNNEEHASDMTGSTAGVAANAAANGVAGTSVTTQAPFTAGAQAIANGLQSSAASNYVAHGSTSSSTTTTSSTTLSAQDISLLTTAIKGSFSNNPVVVAGDNCTTSSQCTHQTNLSVYPLRWGKAQGLDSSVAMTIKSSNSGSVPVEFDLTIKFQDSSLVEQALPLTLKPTEVSVQTKKSGTDEYKTYQFQFANVTVLGTEQLTQVQASITFQTAGASIASPVLTAQSALTFDRSKVMTVTQNWDATLTATASRSPAADAPYVIADSIPYSITIQKQ